MLNCLCSCTNDHHQKNEDTSSWTLSDSAMKCFPTFLCVIHFLLFFQLEVELRDLRMLKNYGITELMCKSFPTSLCASAWLLCQLWCRLGFIRQRYIEENWTGQEIVLMIQCKQLGIDTSNIYRSLTPRTGEIQSQTQHILDTVSKESSFSVSSTNFSYEVTQIMKIFLLLYYYQWNIINWSIRIFNH